MPRLEAFHSLLYHMIYHDIIINRESTFLKRNIKPKMSDRLSSYNKQVSIL